MKSMLKIGLGLAVFIWFSLSLSAIGNIAHLFYSKDSCIPAMSNNEWLKDIGSVITRAPDDKDPLLLKDLTPFEWDRFFIFPPYTFDTTLISTVGFRPRLLGCTGIYGLDDRRLLVFLKSDALVAFADVPRATLQWRGVKGGEAIESRDSWFCVNKHNGYVSLERCTADGRLNFDSKNGGRIF